MASPMEPVTGQGAFAITKSDTVVFVEQPSALYIGGTGDVNVVTTKGQTVLFSAVPVGAILPIKVKQVLSTSTTASLIIGITY
jgi:hypothetical protein